MMGWGFRVRRRYFKTYRLDRMNGVARPVRLAKTLPFASRNPMISTCCSLISEFGS
jgi:hypothetical protein